MYNLFLIPENNGRIKKIRLSPRQIRFLAGGIVVSILFILFNTVGFWYYRGLYASLQKDRLAVVAFEQQKKDLLSKVEILGKTVGETEKMAGHLASLVGSERIPLAKGIGPIPPISQIPMISKFTLSSLQPDLNELEDKTLNLQMKIRELTKVQEGKLLSIASTPSIWPVKGWVTSEFGARRSPFTLSRDFHEGLDIAAQWGTPIVATADGVVTFSGYKGGLGKTVIIDHGFGTRSYYGHNSSILVHEGQKVTRGSQIALIGNTGHSTGPHLHYEIHVDSLPVDPMKYILQ